MLEMTTTGSQHSFTHSTDLLRCSPALGREQASLLLEGWAKLSASEGAWP